MENFFYDDKFYSELSDLIDDVTMDGDPNELDDDWGVTCFESKLEPLVVLSKSWLQEIIFDTEEERFPEEHESTNKKLSKALDCIDFSMANELMPKLYYPTKTSFTINKKDVLEYFND